MYEILKHVLLNPKDCAYYIKIALPINQAADLNVKADYQKQEWMQIILLSGLGRIEGILRKVSNWKTVRSRTIGLWTLANREVSNTALSI